MSDRLYRIDENSNYPEGEGNLFLMKWLGPCRETCIGGADKQGDGRWVASVFAPYEPETDTDCTVLGTFDTRAEAWDALWDARYTAEQPLASI